MHRHGAHVDSTFDSIEHSKRHHKVILIILHYMHLCWTSLGNATRDFPQWGVLRNATQGFFLQCGEVPQYPKRPALESFSN